MKRRQVIPERGDGASQPKLQAPDLGKPTFDQAQLATATYLNVAESMAYLKVFPSIDAFYHWISRYRIPRGRVGRKLVFLRRDLDEAVQQPQSQHVRESPIRIHDHRRAV